MVHHTELRAFEDLRRYEEFNRRPFILSVRKVFEKILQQCSFQGKTVLEVGCGGASFQKWYRGARLVVLSDLNPTLLRLNGGLSAKVACDGEFLSFKDRSFHRIILFGALHHYADQEAGLLELKRLLAPGGTIFMAEPRRRSLNVFYRLLRRLFLRWARPELLTILIGCFSPDESLVDEKKISIFFQEGYRLDHFNRFCVRFPPFPLLRRWGGDVFLSRFLDRLPSANRFGTMLYMTIQNER